VVVGIAHGGGGVGLSLVVVGWVWGCEWLGGGGGIKGGVGGGGGWGDRNVGKTSEVPDGYLSDTVGQAGDPPLF